MEVSFLDEYEYPYAAHTHRPGLGIPSPSLYSFALTIAVHVIEIFDVFGWKQTFYNLQLFSSAA